MTPAEAQVQMHRHGLKVGQAVTGLVRQLDQAHAAGLSIPPKAAEALEVLGALSLAWTANGSGKPAPIEAKRTLGLETGLS